MARLVAKMVLLVVVVALVMKGSGALMKEKFDTLILYLL
jgi:hypothetical protein